MGSLLRKLTRDELADEFSRKVAQALRESEPAGRIYTSGTGGDWARMRGIPTIARGVSGAIRGTQPEREVCRRG